MCEFSLQMGESVAAPLTYKYNWSHTKSHSVLLWDLNIKHQLKGSIKLSFSDRSTSADLQY